MTMARRLWLLTPLLALAVTASAQTSPEVEIGYRWLNFSGSSDVYRSQVNERSGILLHSFTFSTTDNALGDYFRLDATDLGVGPAGALRIESGKSGTYRFSLSYRHADAFSALPDFANPLLSAGVVPGQQTFDRKRNMVDANVELLRWSKFTPFAGVSWNRYDGPGTSTYHVGEDEFLLLQSLRDTDREMRIGTGFDLGPVQGQITQGWRHFRGNESLTLAPGASNGNNSGPVLGQPISVTNLTTNNQSKVDTPFTNVYVTGLATSRVRLVGDYVRFAADSNSSGNEDITGSLASFALSRFYNGLTEDDSGRAHNTTWRGGARAEVALTKGLDLLAGWQHESRELSGSALIDSLFLQSITFGGANPGDVKTILNSSNSLDRKEDDANVALSAHSFGPFSLRAGYSLSKQDVTVTPDLSEIVVASSGGQGGTFQRRVHSVDVDGSYATKDGFTLGAAFKHSNAGDPILRTDFLRRDRFRVRAAWTSGKVFRAGISAEETKQSSDRSDVNYDAKIREYTEDVSVTPNDVLSLRASASHFRSDSSILYRLPQNFTTGDSIQIERGNASQAGFTLLFPRVTFDGDLSRFDNNGTMPFLINRLRGRLTFPLYRRYGLAAEWARDKYTQPSLAIADYQASRYGVFLRFTP
jgi:hypothetical protein